MLEGLRGECSIAELYRREGIAESLYYSWSKDFLEAHDMITSPAFTVIKAADEYHTKTIAPNQMWQTDFTYFKVVGWGWFYLSTVLDDYSRYIVAWRLCTTMKVQDVTDTLQAALEATGLDHMNVKHRPRLLSDNGPSYIAEDLADWLTLRQRRLQHQKKAA